MAEETKKKIDLSEVSDDELISEIARRAACGNIIGYKIWTVEDIKETSCVKDDDDNCVLTDEQCASIAQYIGIIDALTDCTDEEWDALDDEVYQACHALDIKLPNDDYSEGGTEDSEGDSEE